MFPKENEDESIYDSNQWFHSSDNVLNLSKDPIGNLLYC